MTCSLPFEIVYVYESQNALVIAYSPTEHDGGAKVHELAREHGVSAQTIYNWRAKLFAVRLDPVDTVHLPDERLAGGGLLRAS